jgi:hypothetical protein
MHQSRRTVVTRSHLDHGRRRCGPIGFEGQGQPWSDPLGSKIDVDPENVGAPTFIRFGDQAVCLGLFELLDEVAKGLDDVVLADLGTSEADIEEKLTVGWLEAEEKSLRSAGALFLLVLEFSDVVSG